MEKDKEIQMKQHVLSMLHDFMMEGEGGKFKPKSIEVEMSDEPAEEKEEGKQGLGEFLKEASADAPEMEEGDEEADEPKKMSPREFFKRK
jgi:hypothetical protein